MTTLEHFQKEKAYNRAHSIFAPFDDEEMGARFPGYFMAEIVEEGQACLNIIFDNGEHFVYDYAEETLFYVNKLPEALFIHKFLEKVIYDFLVEHQLQKGYLPIYCSRNEVSVTSLIRLLIDRDEKLVDLTNIVLPPSLRHKGLGLKMISDIYAICKRIGYRFIISMMVERFYQRMVLKGAAIIDFDTVEITDETTLFLQ